MFIISTSGKLIADPTREALDEMDISIARSIENIHEVRAIGERIKKSADALTDLMSKF